MGERKYRFAPRMNQSGSRNHNATLEKSDLPLIMDLLNSGMIRKEVAEKFEVGKSTIDRIANGKHWLCREDQDERYITTKRCGKARINPEEDERYVAAKQLVFSGLKIREALQEVGLSYEQWMRRIDIETKGAGRTGGSQK